MNIQGLVDNFQSFDDWEGRYQYLIELGKALPVMAESLQTEDTKVRGCMSQVWMVLGWNDAGRLIFLADSDALIVKGLIAILRTVYEGKTQEEINKTDIEKMFTSLGLDAHLSPNRRNGFFSMVENIRRFTGSA